MFGKKDTIKEFEQMRQALKPAERFAVHAESAEGQGQEPVVTSLSASGLTAGPSAGTNVGPRSAASSPENCSSVVSLGSNWQGNLKIEGSVRIEGQVTGEVDAKDTIFVAETARVDAKVRAAFVVIAGDFQGEVHCTERLEILPSGRVRAQLTTKSLTVAEGAFIEGQIRMSNGPQKVEPVTPTGLPRKTDGGAPKLIGEKVSPAVAEVTAAN